MCKNFSCYCTQSSNYINVLKRIYSICPKEYAYPNETLPWPRANLQFLSSNSALVDSSETLTSLTHVIPQTTPWTSWRLSLFLGYFRCHRGKVINRLDHRNRTLFIRDTPIARRPKISRLMIQTLACARSQAGWVRASESEAIELCVSMRKNAKDMRERVRKAAHENTAERLRRVLRHYIFERGWERGWRKWSFSKFSDTVERACRETRNV